MFTADAFRLVIATGKVPRIYEWAEYEPTRHGRKFYPGSKKRVGHLIAFALCTNGTGEQEIRLFFQTARKVGEKWVRFSFAGPMQDAAVPSESEIVTIQP